MSPQPLPIAPARRPIAPARRPRPARRTAFLAALALVAALLAACSGSHPPVSASTSTSIASTTTTTQPPPQYAPSPYSWDRVASPALAVGGGRSATLSAVLAPDPVGAWLIFGSRLGPSGTPTATVWSSQDGAVWSASTLASGPSSVTAALQYRAETMAVGSTGEGANQQAAVWVSPGQGDPFTLQSVPTSNGPSVMTHIAAGALGTFAVGTVDGRFAMWSSTNGRQWSELPGAERVIGASPGARVTALIADGDYVYAAGSVQTGTVPQAALWVTPDGLNWHAVNTAPTSFTGPGGRVIYSLAPLGTGLVAVGAINEGAGWQPASWISPDGQSWSLPSLDFPALPHAPAGPTSLGPSGGSAARSVSAIPSLAGSTAVVASGGGPYGQAAWRSSDGLHWSSLSMPARYAGATSWRAEMAAATADTAVVVDAEPGQPYVLTDRSSHSPPPASSDTTAVPVAIAGAWSEPSANPAVFGPIQPQAVPVALRSAGGGIQLTVDVLARAQVIGPARVSTVSLYSVNGSTWSATPARVASAGVPPSLPLAGARTARLPGLWVAAAPSTGAGSGLAAAVWTSAAGVTWKKAAVLTVPSAAVGGSTTSTSTGHVTSGTTRPTDVAVTGVCVARVAAASGSAPSTTSPAGSPSTHPSTRFRYVAAAVGSAAVSSATPVAGGGGSVLGGITTTRSATAWASSNGVSWREAAVGGPPPSGGTSSMSGCVGTTSGLVAYGTATGPGGVPEPALWRSPNGSSWSRVAVSAFTPNAPGPLLSVAAQGPSWIATAGPDPTADPFSTAGGAGPAAGAGSDAGVGPAPSLEDGRNGMWLSPDGGSTWQIIDTSTAPWLGAQRSVVDLAGFAPGAAVHAASGSGTTTTTGTSAAAGSIPVVVGVMDGQLAVWTGTAVPGT